MVIDAKRDVSDVQWSHSNPDLLFIAFSYYPQIIAVDLNAPLTVVATFEVGRLSNGGYSSLLLIRGATSGPRKAERIVAGSSGGTVRMWLGVEASRKVMWEVSTDPLSSRQSGAAVVSLLQPECGREAGGLIDGSFISLDSNGVLVVWDYVNVKKGAFCLDESPTVLCRINIFDLCCTVLTTEAKYKVSEKIKVVAMGPYRWARPFSYMVTFSSGDVVMVNIFDHICDPLITSTPATNVQPILSDFDPSNVSLPSFQGISCPAVVLQGQISPLVLFVEISNHWLSIDYPLIEQGRLRRSLMISGSANGKIKSPKRVATSRCLNFHSTLWVHIVKCQSQSKEMILSQDCGDYLVSSRIAHSWPSRTHEFDVDWGNTDIIMRGATAGLRDGITNAHACRCVVASVSSCGKVVTLDSPYAGPSISGGEPKVLIRVNLTFGPIEPAKQMSPPSYYMPYPCSVTSVASHGNLPYAVVGFANDDVKILTCDVGLPAPT